MARNNPAPKKAPPAFVVAGAAGNARYFPNPECAVGPSDPSLLGRAQELNLHLNDLWDAARSIHEKLFHSLPIEGGALLPPGPPSVNDLVGKACESTASLVGFLRTTSNAIDS